MPALHQVIYIEPDAPRKPALGAKCNGCGICCLVAPCPLGVVLSGRRAGACDALRWEPAASSLSSAHPAPQAPTQSNGTSSSNLTGMYRCGAISEPSQVLSLALPTVLKSGLPVLAWALDRLAKRWVAAGKGCDSSLDVEAVGSGSSPDAIILNARMPHD